MGAIAGIVIGVVILVAAVGALAYFCFWRRNPYSAAAAAKGTHNSYEYATVPATFEKSELPAAHEYSRSELGNSDGERRAELGDADERRVELAAS